MQIHLQRRRTNEPERKRGMVVVAAIVRDEEDRKGEQRVATEFHPVICVGQDPFTVIALK